MLARSPSGLYSLQERKVPGVSLTPSLHSLLERISCVQQQQQQLFPCVVGKIIVGMRGGQRVFPSEVGGFIRVDDRCRLFWEFREK